MNGFENYKPDILPHPIRRIGKAILELFSLHQLSSHGDHTFDHPVDDMLLGETGQQEFTWTYPDGTS